MNQETTPFPLLMLPNELIMHVISYLPLSSMLFFRGTVKKVDALVQREVFKISHKKYAKLQAQYNNNQNRLSIIQNNFTILKEQYQPLHPDYAIYKTLESLSREEQIKTAADSSQPKTFKEVFLRYPTLYQSHLFTQFTQQPNYIVKVTMNYENKKVLIATPRFSLQLASALGKKTLNQLLSDIKENYNQLPLMEYFACTVITSGCISPKYCIKALAIIRQETSNFQVQQEDNAPAWRKITKNFSKPEVSLSYRTDEAWKKSCQDMGQIYDFLKAILDGCSHDPKDQKQLCEKLIKLCTTLESQAHIKNQVSKPKLSSSSTFGS